MAAAQIRAGELDVFLKGGGALDINSVRKKPRVSAYTPRIQCQTLCLTQPFLYAFPCPLLIFVCIQLHTRFR